MAAINSQTLSKKPVALLLSVLYTIGISIYGYTVIQDGMYLDPNTPLSVFSWLGWVSVLWAVFSWWLVRREILCPYIIFLCVFYLFCYGQCFLWAVGITPEGYDISRTFLATELVQGQVFTLISLNLFHIGGLLTSKRVKPSLPSAAPSSRPGYPSHERVIRIAALILLAISIVPYIMDLVAAVQTAAQYGYKGLYSEYLLTLSKSEKIFRSFGEFLIPALLCLFVVSKKRWQRGLLLIAVLLKSAAELYLGGRGDTAMLLLCLICVWHYTVHPFNARRAIPLAAGGYFVAGLFASIAQIRGQTGRSLSDFFVNLFSMDNPIFRLVGELGGTMRVLIDTMRLVPATYPFRYGMSYLYSLTTIIPNLGFWAVHPAVENAHLAQWLMDVMNLNYGPGYSMVAEGYINFGWGGVFAMLVYGMLLGWVFTLVHRSNWREKPELLCIELISLVIVLVSGTRSSFVDIFRSFLYIALVSYLLMLLVRAVLIYQRNKEIYH